MELPAGRLGPMNRRTLRGTIRTTAASRDGSPRNVDYRLDRIEDGSAPLVLCLHGWGMDPDWFARLLHGLTALPFQLLYPRAPFPVERRDGEIGGSWYDYDGDSDRFRRELERLERLLLDLLVQTESEHALSPHRRALLGFSQGGYGGSFAVLSNPGLFRALVVSGARIKVEALGPALPAAAAGGLRVLGCHGDHDAQVDGERSRRSIEALQQAGIAAEWRSFDSGHSIGRAQVAAIRDWLGPILTE